MVVGGLVVWDVVWEEGGSCGGGGCSGGSWDGGWFWDSGWFWEWVWGGCVICGFVGFSWGWVGGGWGVYIL